MFAGELDRSGGIFQIWGYDRGTHGTCPLPKGKSCPKSQARRSISDAALRAAKSASRTYRVFAGNGLYLEVKSNGAKLWRWREHMFDRAMVGNGLYESGRFVLIYPKQNHHCESASALILLCQVSRR